MQHSTMEIVVAIIVLAYVFQYSMLLRAKKKI
jgi:hypothetical protein